MEMLLYFLPMIVFLGIVTSYEDVKFGKIRNKWIVLALLYSFSVLFILILNLHFSGIAVAVGYIYDYAINFIFSFLFGFFIWYGGLWSEGDAKLFLAYSTLLPLSAYMNSYVYPFPSVMILINSFVPLFIFFAFKLFFQTDLTVKIKSLKRMMDGKQIASLLISVFGISSLFGLVFSIFGITLDMFTSLFLFFLVYALIEKILGKNQIKFMGALSIALAFLNFENIITVEFLNSFLILFFSYVFIRYFLIRLGYDVFTKDVSINELEEGMVMSDVFYKEGGIYKKREGVRLSINPRSENLDILTDSRFLIKSDIRKIKTLHRDGKFNFKTVKINETISFAPAMFAGVLITILLKGSLLLFADFLLSVL